MQPVVTPHETLIIACTCSHGVTHQTVPSERVVLSFLVARVKHKEFNLVMYDKGTLSIARIL